MKWEYKTVSFHEYDPTSLKELNVLGRQGWEAVSVGRASEYDYVLL